MRQKRKMKMKGLLVLLDSVFYKTTFGIGPAASCVAAKMSVRVPSIQEVFESVSEVR